MAVYLLLKIATELNIIINGGITTLAETREHLNHVDGVMVGREAYSNPFLLANVDEQLFDHTQNTQTRKEIAKHYIDYCQQEMAQGTRLHHLSRHILGLFQGEKGARRFRRHISENAYKEGATIDVLIDALQHVA